MWNTRSTVALAVVAALVLLGMSDGATAQEPPLNQTPVQNSETDNNWMGLAPYIPIPTLALSEGAKKLVREAEDRQLQERRSLEDKYQTEFRDLMKKQADEREALLARIANP